MALAIPTISSPVSSQIDQPNPVPTSNPTSRFISLLKSCSNIKEFLPVHALLTTTGLIHHPVITNHAFQHLISINHIDYCRNILAKAHQSETEFWNTLLENQLKLEDPSNDVFFTYNAMVSEGIMLDVTTFHFLIHACCKYLDVKSGDEVHGRILKYGLGGYRSLKNNMMGMYSKSGELEKVRTLFRKFDDRNVISWNTMISCCVRMGLPNEALFLFPEMMLKGVRPDEITMISLVSACTKLKDLKMGEELHLYIERNDLEIAGSLLNCLVDMYVKCGSMEKADKLLEGRCGYEVDVILCTTLLSGYLKSGEIDEARHWFDKMTARNLISWTTIISGYVQNGSYYKSLELFRRMRLDDVVPDEVALVTTLSASAHIKAGYLGRSIHCLVVKYGTIIDGFLGSALIHLYAKCGAMDEAQLIFKHLPDKSVVSWNAMLDGLCRNAEFVSARTFFDEIPEKDVVSWNTVINCCAKFNQFGELFELFRKMQGSIIKPDKPTLLSLISSCASVGALDHGIWIHVYIKTNNIELDGMLATALIDMYGKCGSVEKAYDTFSEIREKNLFMWTAIISAYAMVGDAEKAIDLFLEMEAATIKPDHVTFIALLSACSQGGFVDKGYEYFNKMSSLYNISPRIQHYGCMVDLLGRTGRLEAAVKFIQSMPIKPDISIWSSLLRASEIYLNVELAEHAFKHMIETNPQSDSAHVLLSNVYAQAGRWEHVSWARKKLKDLGVQKQAGCSVIEQNGIIHEFTAKDFSDPQSPEIYSMLDEIKQRLKKEGFQETSSHHSEKLAVAYGLLSSHRRTPIRVVNNVRMCNDCHLVMKLISQVYERVLVIRDNYKFHRFQGGICSCKDYW